MALIQTLFFALLLLCFSPTFVFSDDPASSDDSSFSSDPAFSDDSAFSSDPAFSDDSAFSSDPASSDDPASFEFEGLSDDSVSEGSISSLDFATAAESADEESLPKSSVDLDTLNELRLPAAAVLIAGIDSTAGSKETLSNHMDAAEDGEKEEEGAVWVDVVDESFTGCGGMESESDDEFVEIDVIQKGSTRKMLRPNP